jgi:putative restriction endonuclease
MNIDITKLVKISTLKKITVADSFVIRANKIGTASGEAKLYVGHDNSNTWDFFGEPGFKINCYIKKFDLLALLFDLKTEYFNPRQDYINSDAPSLKRLWSERYEKIQSLDDVTWFECSEQEQIRGVRVYVKSTSESFKIIREICLPNLSFISIDKFKDGLGHNYYCFTPFVLQK